MTGHDATTHRWLTIIGIGEDGVDGLSPAARNLITTADIVFGGERHFALAAPLIQGRTVPWPSPFNLDPLLAERGRNAVVLASGDPFQYGVGATIARNIPIDEMLVLPAPSAFSLAASRLGWSLPEITTLSLHGRPIELLRPHLFDSARILALTSDGEAPRLIAQILQRHGFGRSRLHVLEALGGPREAIRTATAQDFELEAIDPLNTLAIEVIADPSARILARAPGLPDSFFESDGQITKREIRALTISALSPRPDDLLWDIGSGSGSVAIEWMLADRSLKGVAIEPRADRADRILRNAAMLGVPGLALVRGEAPEALAGLPSPHAIFIGGGASRPGVLDTAIDALASGGRLVVNAVTLETEALLIARHAALGGSLIRISIDRAEKLAGMTSWTPARPLTQWSWSKP